jgi:hypothetical protein
MVKPTNELDYEFLEQQKSPRYKLAEVQHRLEKVAFGVVRFNDGPADELWEVVQGNDGEYLVAKYSPDLDEAPKTASKSPWEILVKEGSQEVQLFYKGIAFAKFAHSNPQLVKRFLPTKLADNKPLLQALINSLSNSRKTELLTLFPELA